MIQVSRCALFGRPWPRPGRSRSEPGGSCDATDRATTTGAASSSRCRRRPSALPPSGSDRRRASPRRRPPPGPGRAGRSLSGRPSALPSVSERAPAAVDWTARRSLLRCSGEPSRAESAGPSPPAAPHSPGPFPPTHWPARSAGRRPDRRVPAAPAGAARLERHHKAGIVVPPPNHKICSPANHRPTPTPFASQHCSVWC
jgi:hypothetical protein